MDAMDFESQYQKFEEDMMTLPSYLANHPPLKDVAALRDFYLAKKKEYERNCSEERSNMLEKNLSVIGNILFHLSPYFENYNQNLNKKYFALEKKFRRYSFFLGPSKLEKLLEDVDMIISEYCLVGNTMKEKELSLLGEHIKARIKKD